jgi:HD-like signal output (HDOD) protein
MRHDEPTISAASHAQTLHPVEKVLRRIRQTEEFPSISKYVVEINQKISDHAVQSSASELANIILKDYALTNKLLKLVNSAFYGFVASKVTTVTRAVVLLGYDNVRLAAVSLLLFEHFKSRAETKDLKDATISSFWCGLIAKEIAKIQSTPDPEEAFICALLNQLGKLLVIYHMPQEYRKIKSLEARQNENEMSAVNKVLGASYKAIGLAVARQWNFPDSIYETMAPLSIDALADRDKSIDPLCAVANFANTLCSIIDSAPLERRKDAMDRLLGQYQNYVTITASQLKTVMGDCLDKLYKHADALQFSVKESHFLSRLSGEFHDAGKQTDGDEVHVHSGSRLEMDDVFHLTGGEEINASVNLSEGDDAVGIIMEGIQEISSAMMGDYDINDIALMSLEVIYRALRCRRAILFIHEARSKTMEARYGYGADIERIVGKVTFRIKFSSASDLFSQALKSDKDLVVEDAHAPKLNPLMPLWYRNSIDAKAFIFMPIAFKKVCVGAYYADLGFTRQPVNALEHKYLAMLRNHLILGIKMGR